uniref:Uncharacterized protein n=1 Tax=Aegilops tauschii subsp. strangulata TaxID=200361 RepID=A0A453NFL2_AEGTS
MHSTLSVSGLQCILRTQVLFSREIRVIFSWQLTYEKLVSQKKNLCEAGLILKLLQTPRYCRDCLFKYNAIDGISRGMKKT